MVNLTAAERVYEYWIDKASSAADLVLKIVFAVILFLVAKPSGSRGKKGVPPLPERQPHCRQT